MKRVIILICVIIGLNSIIFAAEKNTFYEKNGETYYYDSYGGTAKDRWVVVDNIPYFANESGKILKNTMTPDVVYVDENGKYKYNGNVDISLQDVFDKDDNSKRSVEIIENKKDACLVLKSISKDSDVPSSKNKVSDEILEINKKAEIEIDNIIEKELSTVKKRLRDYRSVFIVVRYTDTNINNYKIYLSFTFSLKNELNKPSFKYSLKYNLKNKKLDIIEPKNKNGKVWIFNPIYYDNNIYYYEKKDKLARNKTVTIGKTKHEFNANGALKKENYKEKLFDCGDNKYYIKSNLDFALSEWVIIDGKETGFSYDAHMLTNEAEFDGAYVADVNGHKLYNDWIIIDSKDKLHTMYYADENGYKRLSAEFHEDDLYNQQTCHFCNKNVICANINYTHDYKRDEYIRNHIEYKNETYYSCLDCYKNKKYKNLVSELNIKAQEKYD